MMLTILRRPAAALIVLALLTAPVQIGAQGGPPVPGQTPSSSSQGGPPALSVPSPNVQRSNSGQSSSSRTNTNTEKLTPQQQAMRDRKLADAKVKMQQLQERAKTASLQKLADFQHRELTRRIALWNAAAALVRPEAKARLNSQTSQLSSLDAQVFSTRRPVDLNKIISLPQYARQGGGSVPQVRDTPGPTNANGGCSTPRITTLSVSQGQPGDPVVITGSNFGSNPGQVYFIINSNAVAASAIPYWGDMQIATAVPSVTGIASPYNGNIYVQTCAQSNIQPFQFQPQIVVQPLPITSSEAQLSAKSNGGNFDWPPGACVWATADFFTGKKGDDQFFDGYRLANGWVLDSADFNPGIAADSGNGASLANANYGSAQPLVDVHWWVDAPYGGEEYCLTIYIHGPVGVPYQ